MHRSGTSVITQLLGIAGAKLPAELIGATKDNEYGHWEPVWLNDRNDRPAEGSGQQTGKTGRASISTPRPMT
jgi:hypothetical protein